MRPPILWIAAGFGVGLWVGLVLFGEWGVGMWGVGLPVLVGGAVLWRRAPVGTAVGIAAVAGLVWAAAAMRVREATCAGQWGGGEGEGGSVAAIIRLADPAPAAGGVVDGRVLGGSCGGTLRLRWPEGTAARGGTTWVVAGRWLGTKDRGVLVARRTRLLDTERRGRGALRDRIAERSAALFGARAPLVDALVIARRAELEPEIRERYTRSGLAHLLSISGLHVGFIAGWLGVLLRRCRLSAVGGFGAGAALVFGYVWMLGLPPPALRAAVMLVLLDFARLHQRVVAPRGTIGLAALAVMLVDPWAVRSVGAWLSVAAVAAVIWAGRATAGKPVVVRLLAPALAATLFTAPITALAFGIVAPIGVVANLVAIPLGAIAVPGLLIALILSWIVPTAAALIAAGAGLGLALLDAVAGIAAAVPGGHVVATPGWATALAWTGVTAVAWWLWHSPRRPWLIAARLAFVATLSSWTLAIRDFSLDGGKGLTVHFLEVGQGDAAVLRTPGGRWIVIDGGPRTPDRDAGRRVVVPFLRKRGVARLALLVATHGDADHLGGLPAVIDAFPPGLVLEPGEPLGRPLYLEFLAAVEGSGAAWHPARTGDRIELDGVLLEVLSPDSAWLAQPLDANEHSVVLRVTYGGVRLLLTGDAGVPVEARLAGRVGAVDLLKVGHHGSRSASSEEWLAELRPAWAVISVGRRNRYGHPAPEVLERLAAQGVTIFRTDQSGTITFGFDGQRAHTNIRHHD
ncbi:MAG: DNA internalization-related competence protein ComEC/Rec2 [Gemmatimonadetes bacterium]|nr:DNA internalization-related competence protein ComEC/Rec2 [Gemmatimonadota bacterium]